MILLSSIVADVTVPVASIPAVPLEVPIFRIILNLFFVVLFSFLSSMIGLLTILGFAADENAGDIFPYYLSISFIVCVLNTVTYYFTIKIKQN